MSDPRISRPARNDVPESWPARFAATSAVAASDMVRETMTATGGGGAVVMAEARVHREGEQVAAGAGGDGIVRRLLPSPLTRGDC